MTKLFNLLFVIFLSSIYGFFGSKWILCYKEFIGIEVNIYIGVSISLGVLILYSIIHLAVSDVLTERKEKEDAKS